MARFSGVFFEQVRMGLLIVLCFTAPFLILKMPSSESHLVLPWLFAFCPLGTSVHLSGGVRLLRSLPLSAGHLALTLLLLPFLTILAMVAALGILEIVYPGHFLSPHSCSYLIPMSGTVCIASSLYLPFTGQSNRFILMLLGMVASLVVIETVANVDLPATFWWLLGLGLMAAAFFLNRHWLRSSASYRPSAANSQRR
jgi:hypothetical protein